MQYENMFCPFCHDYRTFKRMVYADGEETYNCTSCGFCPESVGFAEREQQRQEEFENLLRKNKKAVNDHENTFSLLDDGTYQFEYASKNMVFCKPSECIGFGKTLDDALNNASEKAEKFLRTCPKCHKDMGKEKWLYGDNFETTPKWSCDCGYERVGIM